MSGCTFAPLDPANHTCPCPGAEWECVDSGSGSNGVCVPRAREDASIPPDAGRDAAPFRDAQMGDGGDRDAGMDAGVMDAGDAGSDAGVLDAAVDAGPVDAGPVDAGLGVCDAVPAPVFCEDFEAEPLGMILDGSISREVGSAPRGTGLLYADYEGSGTSTNGVARRTIDVSGSNDLWVSVLERHTQEMTGSGFSTLFIRTSPSGGGAGHHVALNWDISTGAGTVDRVSLFRSDDTTGTLLPAENAVAVDAWHCFVIHVSVGVTGTLELFVDGEQVVSQVVDTSDFDRFVGVELGTIFVTSAEGPIDVRYDDLVVDTVAPSACMPSG
ncbi:MAG: hypothetical protein AB8I08_26150 [Sandaracinaceae bacterium]